MPHKKKQTSERTRRRELLFSDEAGNLLPSFKTPEQGASTTVWACVAPELEGIGGLYLYRTNDTRGRVWTTATGSFPLEAGVPFALSINTRLHAILSTLGLIVASRSDVTRARWRIITASIGRSAIEALAETVAAGLNTFQIRRFASQTKPI